MSEIHPTAVIAAGAKIGHGSTIGPYSIIGPSVVLGQDNRVGPHVVIDGHTTIGDGNQIFQFASVGAVPQDLRYAGEASRLIIGSRNIIREYATLQPGTEHGGMETKVGDQNLFMACSHVAHDCTVGNHNIFANCAVLAGHVLVENHAILGGLSAVHQFARIGSHSMLGGGTMVSSDIPPFCIAQGDRAQLVGINHIGLGRRGYSEEQIRALRKLFRELFNVKGSFLERAADLATKYKDQPCQELLQFVSTSERGIASARRGAQESDDQD